MPALSRRSIKRVTAAAGATVVEYFQINIGYAQQIVDYRQLVIQSLWF